MAQNKTTQTNKDVGEFISNISDLQKRDDSFKIIALLEKVTGFEPKMWGPTIIGFGIYHYVYASGHGGDMPLAAFSPRKDAIVFYIESEFEGREQLLQQLGKHKTGKVCVYVKKLDDIDLAILEKLITTSIEVTKATYPD